MVYYLNCCGFFHHHHLLLPGFPLKVHFSIAVLLLGCSSTVLGGLPHDSETFLRELPLQYEVVHPARVDAKGHFLSHFLSHRGAGGGRVQRRDASDGPGGGGGEEERRVFYRMSHGAQDLRFNISLNPNLLAPGFVTERRRGGAGLDGVTIKRNSGSSQCHFLGEVWDQHSSRRGGAAISTCEGLTGLFRVAAEEFFIRPLESSSDDESPSPQAHVIYRRHAQPSGRQTTTSQPRASSPSRGRPTTAQTTSETTSGTQTTSETTSGTQTTAQTSGRQTTAENVAVNGTCGVKDPRLGPSSEDPDSQRREGWERRRGRGRRRKRIRQRSVSKEKWVETLVVVDPKMVEYHGGSEAVESYALAVMNIVSGLFRDASIGNAINIAVVRLIILEKDEEDLKITHHADNSLNSFCKWQKRLNMKGDEHPTHHDVAVLLTRKDICASINKPCETLGLSHVAGMCQPHRSCSISEDTGLPLAFTVAHELGHNFGIQHDGVGNDCEPVGKRPFVMSPQLLYGYAMPRWSRCSRQYITRFLDRGWGWCLDDAPAKDHLSLQYRSLPPGVLYSAGHQCRLQYGSGSVLCDDVDNICSTLWCTVGKTCHSKLDGAVDGTHCGEDKWCYGGACVAVGRRPQSVHGSWAAWSHWSACSRSCGTGVQNAYRDCVDPAPTHGGRYCLGERRRFKVCNSTPCVQERPSFRDLQCAHFNSMPYKGRLHTWVAVNNRVNSCELHCRPVNENFSEKMLDAVSDGTRCYEGSTSREICIDGICKDVGCDHVIGSNATEDRCGVCHGNGSTCETVKKTYDASEGLGYVDIGLIPEGARDIHIEEVSEAGNFLALRSDDPDQYFLNGAWTIQWNGEYRAAGTVFTYERTGHLENLTSPGPTTEPLWIQLLFQETNPGVRYEYTVRRDVSDDNHLPVSHYSWKYGSWTECSATCGAGVKRQIVHCVERTSGIVDEDHCDLLTRPDDKQTVCNKELCPAVWWAGEWHKCSSSCGGSGLTKRTVLCIRAVSAEERTALQPAQCKHLAPRPEAVTSCNTHVPCPADWSAGHWSKCSLTCGRGLQERSVSCSRNAAAADCDPKKRPVSVAPCSLRECPRATDTPVFEESDESSGGSGGGWSSEPETLNEINSIPEAAAEPLPPPPPRPKHHGGTTRAQQPRSRPGGDLNDIAVVESGFDQNNRIEQSLDRSSAKKKNVHVDDFYYDYNFIKFHEELSYDFDSGNDDDPAEDPRRPQDPKTVPNGPNGEKQTVPATTTSPIDATSVSHDDARTLEDDDPRRHPSPDNVVVDGDDGDEPSSKESSSEESENADAFLSEDYFLPVSTVSPTRRLYAEKWKKGGRPEGHPPHTMPSVASTTNEPTAVTGGERQRDAEDYSEEEVEVEYSATTTTGSPAGQTDILSTANSAEVTEDVYYRLAESTTELASPSLETTLPSETTEAASPSLETTLPSETTEAASPSLETNAIHSETTPSTAQSGFDERRHFNADAGAQRRGSSASDNAVTSYPVSGIAPVVPLLEPISGKRETSSVSGTHALPPTHAEEDSSPSFLGLAASQPPLPTPRPKLATTTRSFSTPQTPSFPDYVDYNAIIVPPMARRTGGGGGDIVTENDQLPKDTPPSPISPPATVRPTVAGLVATHPPTTQGPATSTLLGPALALSSVQVPTSSPTAPAAVLVPTSSPSAPAAAVLVPTSSPSAPAAVLVPTSSSKAPAAVLVPTSSPTAPAAVLVPTSSPSAPAAVLVPTSSPSAPASASSTPLTPDAHWLVGNWSACSTSCGLGATWRVLKCSTGSDRDCDVAKRPAPARRCYLRPCSRWNIGEWTKCSKNCEGGASLREVSCFDLRDRRSLRPFHCQAISPRPRTRVSCNPQPCLDWYASSWGPCSEVCGGGEQQRMVTCPEEDGCDPDAVPGSIQPCNVQPCEQWVTGSWGPCSASCGVGVQRRLIKCVDAKEEAESEEEVDQAKCDHEPSPESTLECHLHACESAPTGCVRDRLTQRFCQTLRWLGRCHAPTLRAQCCKTCSHPHGAAPQTRSHGNQQRPPHGNARATRRR